MYPREAILDYLKMNIENRRDKGGIILAIGELNDDVINDNIIEYQESLNIYDVIMDKVGLDNRRSMNKIDPFILTI